MTVNYSRNVRKCSECGARTFIRNYEEYAYKHEHKEKMKYFCSWTCMRKWEKRIGWKPPRKYIEERARRES